MRRFLIALSFFTRIPINIKSEVNEDEFYGSMILLPVIGGIIGGILYGVNYLFQGINPQVRSFCVLFTYIFITGGLHIDGFIDTMDGIMSNRDRKKILEIMKDSRIGAFGSLCLILLLLGYFVTCQFISGISLFLSAIVGRSCAIMSASISEYAKEKNDLGKGFVDRMGIKEMIFALSFSAIITLLLDYLLLIPLIICFATTYILTEALKKKINGTTGDTIGMMIEVNQIVFALGSYLILHLI